MHPLQTWQSLVASDVAAQVLQRSPLLPLIGTCKACLAVNPRTVSMTMHVELEIQKRFICDLQQQSNFYPEYPSCQQMQGATASRCRWLFSIWMDCVWYLWHPRQSCWQIEGSRPMERRWKIVCTGYLEGVTAIIYSAAPKLTAAWPATQGVIPTMKASRSCLLHPILLLVRRRSTPCQKKLQFIWRRAVRVYLHQSNWQ